MYLNLNNQKIEISLANNLSLRLWGLMGKKNITKGILFPRCNAIHTFFMKEEIDVVALNEHNEVIAIYHRVSKNKIIKIKNKAKKTSILELPKDTSYSLKIGSIIQFIL